MGLHLQPFFSVYLCCGDLSLYYMESLNFTQGTYNKKWHCMINTYFCYAVFNVCKFFKMSLWFKNLNVWFWRVLHSFFFFKHDHFWNETSVCDKHFTSNTSAQNIAKFNIQSHYNINWYSWTFGVTYYKGRAITPLFPRIFWVARSWLLFQGNRAILCVR